MRTRTTDEWLHELRQPDADRVETVEALRDYLFRAAFLYLRDQRTDLSDLTLAQLRQMAEDFAQEALLAVLDKLDSFREESRFTTWAYRFVVNKAADELRRRRYRDVSLDRLPEQEKAALLSLIETGRALDPDLEAERKEVVTLLLQIIEFELNERQRQAMMGVYFQGRSIQEMAMRLDTSANNLYKMLHDGRRRIKENLLKRQLSPGDILALFEEVL